MARRTGADTFRIMTTARLFNIGVNFDMVDGASAAHGESRSDGRDAQGAYNVSDDKGVTEIEIQAIREFQEDLPQVLSPFDEMSRVRYFV